MPRHTATTDTGLDEDYDTRLVRGADDLRNSHANALREISLPTLSRLFHSGQLASAGLLRMVENGLCEQAG